MADAKIINYGQPIGAGSTAIPDNTAVALDIESTDANAEDYITIDTTEGSENMKFGVGASSDMMRLYSNGTIDTSQADGYGIRAKTTTSATEPVFNPSKNDPNTGIGRAAADQLSLIAGGVEVIRATSKRGATVNGSAVVKGKASFVLTGSIDVTGTNVNVPGTGTKFLSELAIGDAIVVSGETRTIATITNDTTATVTAAWGSDLANDTSPECNPAAFTVIRDTGDLGMVLDDNGLVGLGEVVPSAYWANTNDLVIGSGSSSGITIDASSTGTLCFAYGTSGAAAYQNVIQGTGSGSGDGIRFITAGTTKECIRITTAGDILCPQLDANSDVLTDANKNLTTSSDMRLKNPIAELEAGLDKINQLVPRFFSWKNDEENKSQLGFFSQEVHSICPEAAPKSPKMVSTETEVGEDGANACDGEKVQALDADGNPDFDWSLNSRAIVALLVKSVQELSAKVTALEAGD